VNANETENTLEIALTLYGVCYALEERISRQLADGTLVEVLPEWSSMGPAFHLYYPGRRQLPAALRALLRMIQKSKKRSK
jgi:DNA-binding transcriptional LysR family regulator